MTRRTRTRRLHGLAELVLVAMTALAAACSDVDKPVRAPTDPTSLAKGGGGGTLDPCSDSLARQVSIEIGDLFSGNAASLARARFRTIQDNCVTNRTAAVNHTAGYRPDNTVGYYGWFITLTSDDFQSADHAAAAATHFRTLAQYVGLSTQFYPANFTPDGAIGVCKTDATLPCEIVTGYDILTGEDDEDKHWAGIWVPPGALPSTPSVTPPSGPITGYTFAIAPTLSIDCKRDNLDFVPWCFQFTVTPNTAFQDPFVTLKVCQKNVLSIVDDTDEEQEYYDRLVIAHPTPETLDPLKRIEVYQDAQTNPFTKTFNCNVSDPPGTVATLDPGILMDGLAWLNRAAGAVAHTLAPDPLYAYHTGSTVKSKSLSPIGAVDPLIFRATFNDSLNNVGSPPNPLADKGTWTTIQFVNPGSITVQASLGAYPDTLVVLSQGGGACTNCGSLVLEGTVAGNPPGTFADTGIYDASWVSVQNKPSVKRAPFELRDHNNVVIARLSYSTESSVNILRYNEKVLDQHWVTGQPDSVVINVNFTTRQTTLKIKHAGGTYAPATYASNHSAVTEGFYNKKRNNKGVDVNAGPAADLAKIAADFTGIDAGIMGWARIEIIRRSDPLQ
jgi:hypothetical protein